jgi:hypothetical protein
LGAGECSEYLLSYVRYGGQNDAEQVARLQFVLSHFEGAQIAMTGVYDAATLSAVNAFQVKYADEILAPWSLKGPTGYVYYTTRKKINEVFCEGAKVFPLTASQLEEVEEVSVLNERGVTSRTTVRAQGGAAPATLGATLPSGQPIGGPATTNDDTGATSSATSTQAGGWWSSFWKWLFGR